MPDLDVRASTQPSLRRTALLTLLAMLAFAGNSLLCRLALRDQHIDAASFTSLRLASGALVLALLLAWRTGAHRGGAWALRPGRLAGNWASALALFVYAAGFSFAYAELSAATGALLLFGVVQLSMIGWGLWRGERLQALQWLGLATALTGLLALLLPGLQAPPPGSAALMAVAGLAWGVYSLRGRGAPKGQAKGPHNDATAVTCGNFLRSAPLALALGLLMWPQAQVDAVGVALALASGALASGLGYAVWYAAMPGLSTTGAAVVQLSVPAIAAAGGTLLLGEALTPLLLLASMAVLGGISLVIMGRRTGPG